MFGKYIAEEAASASGEDGDAEGSGSDRFESSGRDDRSDDQISRAGSPFSLLCFLLFLVIVVAGGEGLEAWRGRDGSFSGALACRLNLPIAPYFQLRAPPLSPSPAPRRARLPKPSLSGPSKGGSKYVTGYFCNTKAWRPDAPGPAPPPPPLRWPSPPRRVTAVTVLVAAGGNTKERLTRKLGCFGEMPLTPTRPRTWSCTCTTPGGGTTPLQQEEGRIYRNGSTGTAGWSRPAGLRGCFGEGGNRGRGARTGAEIWGKAGSPGQDIS